MSWSSSMSAGQLVVHGLGSVAAALPGAASWGEMRSAASGLLVWLVLLPLVAAVLPGWLARRTAQRAVVAMLLGAAAVAAYLLVARLGVMVRLGGFFDRADGSVHELVQPLWRVLAVQRLQLAVGLDLDRPAALLLVVAALVAAWVVRGAERAQVAGLAGAVAAVAVALLGDGLVTRLLGWELLTVAGWALGRRRAGSALLVARLGDATLLVATALLFWSLGGSWSSSRLDARYQLDFSPPRAAAVGSVESLAPERGPTLDLPSLRAQLQRPARGEPRLSPASATLYNKLWLGGRLLTWLGVLFALAAALKGAAGVLQLLTERGSSLALRLWLGLAPGLCAAHLLWRLW